MMSNFCMRQSRDHLCVKIHDTSYRSEQTYAMSVCLQNTSKIHYAHTPEYTSGKLCVSHSKHADACLRACLQTLLAALQRS